MARGRKPQYSTAEELEQDIIALSKQSERLKMLMKKHNYSGQQLADLLGRSRQSISAYCNTSIARRVRLQPRDAEELSRLFGVTPQYLMGQSDFATPEEMAKEQARIELESEQALFDAVAELYDEIAIKKSIFSSLGFEMQVFGDAPFDFEMLTGRAPKEYDARIRAGESAWSYFTQKDTDLLIENLKMSVQFAMFKSDQQRHKDV